MHEERRGDDMGLSQTTLYDLADTFGYEVSYSKNGLAFVKPQPVTLKLAGCALTVLPTIVSQFVSEEKNSLGVAIRLCGNLGMILHIVGDSHARYMFLVDTTKVAFFDDWFKDGWCTVEATERDAGEAIAAKFVSVGKTGYSQAA